MKGDNFLLTVAIIAVVVSIAAAGLTYLSVNNLASRISGYATSTGTANITVEKTAIINFTTYELNWSSGRVNQGQSFAFLTTLGQTINGNWSTLSTGLILENIGNANVTLDLAVGKTAASFLGGTSPGYFWNVSNNEANSCTAGSAFPLTAAWNATNSTAPGTRWCNPFQFLNDRDAIRIDINLTVPYDSLTGALTDTITATATAI